MYHFDSRSNEGIAHERDSDAGSDCGHENPACACRTTDTIRSAIENPDPVIVDAPPGAGKTTAIPALVKETGVKVTYLTARTDLYGQMDDLCQDHGLDTYTLPSPHRDCPAFIDGHEEASKLYDRGVPVWRIHQELNLPCGSECPYHSQWNFEPDNYDVLMGHYRHLYVESVVADRVVVIDEFPGDAYITHFPNPGPIVSAFLGEHPELGYNDYTELLEHRHERGAGLSAAHYVYREGLSLESPEMPLRNSNGHALAPLLTLGIIMGVDLENGFESTVDYVPEGRDYDGDMVYVNRKWNEKWRFVLEDRVVVRDRDGHDCWVLTPPDLSAAASVVGLDGTPTQGMWTTTFGEWFTVESVLHDDERARYFRDIRGYTIKCYNRHKKPYSSRRPTLDLDAAVVLSVAVDSDDEPCLISTKKALRKYKEAGILDDVAESRNFAQVRSYNGFSKIRNGIINGSPHPGDDEIKKWGAFVGHGIERKGKGQNLTYGPFGDKIARHFIENAVFQAVCRFGRDGNGATVHVNTSAIPHWLEVEEAPNVSRFMGKQKRKVVKYLMDRGKNGDGVTVDGVNLETGVSKYHIREVLNDLVDGGYAVCYDRAGMKNEHLYEWSP